MKLSLNWAQDASHIDLLKIGKNKLIEKIGAQLSGVDEVVEWGPKYEGIVVVKIVDCVPHPNADKLKVCKVDDAKTVKNVARDTKGLVQVVCGAPNAHEGMLAAWIPPGVTVPSTIDKEPFKLSAKDLRGEMSNGMLASLHELGIGDEHSGILEINPLDAGEKLAKPGTPLKKLYGLDDTVVDCENKMFTHRPDCFGILGLARELAGIQGLAFKSPAIYKENKTTGRITKGGLPLEIKNEIPKLVPRFMAEVLEDVVVGPSPVWMQARLSRVGIRPINNVVDITNYYMMLTGQPLHAYDYDKVKALDKNSKSSKVSIIIRNPKKSEKLTLLGDKIIEPRKEAIVIASATQAIGLGGVMGGADTEVDENTKNIILECANFDMYSIRRSAMEHGIFTDAVTRFTKNQSPLQCDRVLAWASNELICNANATPGAKIYDIKRSLSEPHSIKITPEFINSRLGVSLTVSQITTILENVEFRVTQLAGKQLGITAPFWRTDTEIPEDIVEEVGRLYGYDHLPVILPKRSLKPAKIDDLLATKNTIRNALADAGANEVLTYSFVHEDLLKNAGQNPAYCYQLSNALSPDLQYYRPSLLPSLLDKVNANIRAGYDEFALFEINQTHSKDLIDKDSKLPIEEYRVALVFAANSKVAKEKYQGAPYYQAKKYLTALLDRLNVQPTYEPAGHYQPKMPVSKQAIAPFDKNRTALVKTYGGESIGELGELSSSVRGSFKLPDFVGCFELDVLQLSKLQQITNYSPLPRFPKVQQDISLKVGGKLDYQTLFEFIWDTTADLQPDKVWCSLQPVDIYNNPKDTLHNHITLRLSIASFERTLTDKEVNNLLDKVAEAAKEKFGAERI